jgi:hypothetical protein
MSEQAGRDMIRRTGWLFVALAGQFTTSLLFVIISASFLLLSLL